ncbi:MAG: helix-turn-helix domain-containing protein [Haloarculaceae archaeon]
MGTGILATVAVRERSACPVVPLSREGRVRSVSMGRPCGDCVPLEATVSEPVPDDAAGEEVFSYDSTAVYRLERPVDEECACDVIQRHGCPVRDTWAEDGEVAFSFIAPDLDTLRDVLGDLNAREPGVTVRCLRRSGTDSPEAGSEPVFVDRSVFTDRQEEVLRTAHEMGYFPRPKGANAGEVAEALDIAPSTFAEHLAAAQTKLMDALFEDVAADR